MWKLSFIQEGFFSQGRVKRRSFGLLPNFFYRLPSFFRSIQRDWKQTRWLLKTKKERSDNIPTTTCDLKTLTSSCTIPPVDHNEMVDSSIRWNKLIKNNNKRQLSQKTKMKKVFSVQINSSVQCSSCNSAIPLSSLIGLLQQLLCAAPGVLSPDLVVMVLANQVIALGEYQHLQNSLLPVGTTTVVVFSQDWFPLILFLGLWLQHPYSARPLLVRIPFTFRIFQQDLGWPSSWTNTRSPAETKLDPVARLARTCAFRNSCKYSAFRHFQKLPLYHVLLEFGSFRN